MPRTAHRYSALGAFLALFLFLLAPNASSAQQARVENVKFDFSGNEILVSYDLFGEGLYEITLLLSLNSNTFVPLSAIRGDFGPGVSAGINRTIIWDVYADYPNGFEVESIVFEVVARQMERRKSKSLVYILAGVGAAAAGTLAAVLLGGKDGGNGTGAPITTTIASPPARPPNQ